MKTGVIIAISLALWLTFCSPAQSDELDPEGQAYRAKIRRDEIRRVARFERRIRMAALRYELSAVRRHKARVRRAIRDHH